MTSTEEIILAEIKSLSEKFDAFTQKASDAKSAQEQRLTALETKTNPLFDNGQPGRLTRMETRLTRMEHWRIYVLGYCLGAAFVVSGIVGVAIRLAK